MSPAYAVRNPIAAIAVFLLAGSASFAQDSDIFADYATRKGECGQGSLVKISKGRIAGPGFDCRLGDSRPAGTGLVQYSATCMIDGKRSSDGIALDLGNYDDHFELSLPGRQDWISLYPCTPVPGLKTGRNETESGPPTADGGKVMEPDTNSGGASTASPATKWSPAVTAYMDKYDAFLSSRGISGLAGNRLVVASCANCVPFIVNCREALSAPTDLRGRRTRVSGQTVAFVRDHGGVPVMMPGGEVADALTVGVIECTVGGGGQAN